MYCNIYPIDNRNAYVIIGHVKGNSIMDTQNIQHKRPLNAKEIIYLILCLLNTVYGILVRAIHTKHISFVIWIGIGFFFLVCYFMSRKHIMRKLPSLLRFLVLLVLIAGLALFTFLEAKVISGFTSVPPEGLDYIIVLGAKVYGDEPSPSLRYRLDAAYEYMTENKNTLCILSGGQGKDEDFPEAEIMYDYLIGKGIDEKRLITEALSLDTAENIENSKRYITKKGSAVGIVTNNYHVYRACRTAEALGMEKVYGIPSRSPFWFIPHNMMKEFLSLLKAFVTGNI